MKLEYRVADTDAVALADFPFAADPPVIEKRAVPAAQILKEAVVLDEQDVSMMAAGIRVTDPDVTIGLASQDGLRSVEFLDLPLVRTANHG